MMFSIRYVVGIAVGVIAVCAFRAEANTIVLIQNPYSYNIGGEFTAYTTENFGVNYAASATYEGGFETFCVESDVYYGPGLTYTYTISDQDSTGRALTEGAAYLYSQFATGQLAGYDYESPTVRVAPDLVQDRSVPGSSIRAQTPPSRQMDAGEVQEAIWEFQGHQSEPGYPPLSTDPYYMMAIDALGSAAYSPDDGQFGVAILQLWDTLSAPAQNQLVYEGLVPDCAATGQLLAAAFGGLVLWSRRGYLKRSKQTASTS